MGGETWLSMLQPLVFGYSCDQFGVLRDSGEQLRHDGWFLLRLIVLEMWISLI